MIKLYCDYFDSQQYLNIVNNYFDEHISERTIRSFFKKIKLAINTYVSREMSTMIFDGEVEIDETPVYREKPGYLFARGYQIKVWFVGLRQRDDTKKFLIYPVLWRNRETLLRIILRRCVPGTVIYTDCWSAYKQ